MHLWATVSTAIKLMAGDVSRIQPGEERNERLYAARAMDMATPAVTEKSFDEYHQEEREK